MSLAAISLGTALPTEAGEHVEVCSIVSSVIVRGEGWEKLIGKPFHEEYVTDDYITKDIKLSLRIIATASEVLIKRV